LLQCQLCKADTLHRSYLIQTDGSCREVDTNFLGKYYWWCVSAAIFAGLMGCIGLVFFFQWLCSLCCGCGKRRVC